MQSRYVGTRSASKPTLVHKNDLASIVHFVLFHCWLCINKKCLGKNLLIGSLWGELRLFRVVLRLNRTKKIFKIGQIF